MENTRNQLVFKILVSCDSNQISEQNSERICTVLLEQTKMFWKSKKAVL